MNSRLGTIASFVLSVVFVLVATSLGSVESALRSVEKLKQQWEMTWRADQGLEYTGIAKVERFTYVKSTVKPDGNEENELVEYTIPQVIAGKVLVRTRGTDFMVVHDVNAAVSVPVWVQRQGLMFRRQAEIPVYDDAHTGSTYVPAQLFAKFLNFSVFIPHHAFQTYLVLPYADVEVRSLRESGFEPGALKLVSADSERIILESLIAGATERTQDRSFVQRLTFERGVAGVEWLPVRIERLVRRPSLPDQPSRASSLRWEARQSALGSLAMPVELVMESYASQWRPRGDVVLTRRETWTLESKELATRAVSGPRGASSATPAATDSEPQDWDRPFDSNELLPRTVAVPPPPGGGFSWWLVSFVALTVALAVLLTLRARQARLS